MHTFPFLILIIFLCEPFHISCKEVCDIKILGKYYNMLTLTKFTGRYPDRVAFAEGKMLYSIEGAIYSIDEKGISDNAYSLESGTIQKGIDEFNGQMMGAFEVIEYDNNDQVISQITVQSNKLPTDTNQVRLFTCGENFCIIDLKKSVGSLYVLRKDHIYIAGKLIVAQRIRQLGDDVACLAFDSSTENILIGKGTKNGGSVVLLKKMNDASCSMEISDPVVPNMADMENTVKEIMDKTIEKMADEPPKPVTSELEEDLAATIKQLNEKKSELLDKYLEFVKSLQNADSYNIETEERHGRSKRAPEDKMCILENTFEKYDEKIKMNLANMTDKLNDVECVLSDMNVKVFDEVDYNSLLDVRFGSDSKCPKSSK